MSLRLLGCDRKALEPLFEFLCLDHDLALPGGATNAVDEAVRFQARLGVAVVCLCARHQMPQRFLAECRVAQRCLRNRQPLEVFQRDRLYLNAWLLVAFARRFGSIAGQVEMMLKKGSPVMLEGRLVHRSYAGKDGLKRYITEIVLSDFKVIAYTKREEEAESKAAA